MCKPRTVKTGLTDDEARQLVTAYLNRNQEAQDKFHRLFGSGLKRIIGRFASNEHNREPDVLLNRVFAHLATGLRETPEGEFSASPSRSPLQKWLDSPFASDGRRISLEVRVFTVARSFLLTWVRQDRVSHLISKRSSSLSDEKTVDAMHSSDDFKSRQRTPEEEKRVFRNESAKAVDEAIASLPPHQREVMKKRIAEEDLLSDEDIGDALSVPKGTVANRRRKAEERMKEQIVRNYGEGAFKYGD